MELTEILSGILCLMTLGVCLSKHVHDGFFLKAALLSFAMGAGATAYNPTDRSFDWMLASLIAAAVIAALRIFVGKLIKYPTHFFNGHHL